MKKIGIIFGMESTFPPALVDKIKARNHTGKVADLRWSAFLGASPEPIPQEVHG